MEGRGTGVGIHGGREGGIMLRKEESMRWEAERKGEEVEGVIIF